MKKWITLISILICLLLYAGFVYAEVNIKGFLFDLPEGYRGPVTQQRGPVKILAFVKPHEGKHTQSLIEFSIINLDQAPSHDPIRTAKVTNKEILLGMLRGIKRRRNNFWKGNYKEITLAGIPANKIEWSGYAQGIQLKGIYYTFIYKRDLFAISLQDIVPYADQNLTIMEKAIEKLK